MYSQLHVLFITRDERLQFYSQEFSFFLPKIEKKCRENERNCKNVKNMCSGNYFK